MEAERLKDFDSTVAHWIVEIENAEKHQDKWVEKAKKVLDRYRDYRPEGDVSTKFNILWSNTETLRPAVYFQTPKPNVTRRFKTKDPVALQASQVLERALSFSIDAYDFDSTIRSCVEDYLLPGRGVARGIYKSETEQYQDVAQEGDEGAEQGEDGNFYRMLSRKKNESSECKYWYWEDVIIPKGKKWEDTPWVAFRAYPTRDKLETLAKKGLFTEEVAKEIPLDCKPEGVDKDSPETFQKAVIYEIWDKQSGKVKFLSKSYKKGLLSDKPPGLKLTGFFPIPKPLSAGCTNDSNLPIPLYLMYQDQANELDNLTARIEVLTKALKVSGAYNGAEPNLAKIIEGTENKMIPVENWAMFSEKGGLKGAVDFFPLQDIVNTLISLHEAREKVKQDLYEISGIADIIRGYSDPNETATAQRIKGRFASLRLEDLQKAVQAFIRDLLRIKAEIIADNFEPETLQKMTGIQITPEVMMLLRDDMSRQFRIDIETDSTVRPDEEEEKQRRVEFLEVSGNFLEKAIMAAGASPAIVPLLGEMLLFAVRGFKVGRELEEGFEAAIAQISQQAMQPKEPPPDPALIKAQADVQKTQAQTQAIAQKAQIEASTKAQEIQADQISQSQSLIFDQQKHAQEMAQDQEKHDLDMKQLREKNKNNEQRH